MGDPSRDGFQREWGAAHTSSRSDERGRLGGVQCKLVCDAEQAAYSAVTPVGPMRASLLQQQVQVCTCSLCVWVFFSSIIDARRFKVLVFCPHFATAVIGILQGRCVMTVEAVGGDWVRGRRKENTPTAGKWPPFTCTAYSSSSCGCFQTVKGVVLIVMAQCLETWDTLIQIGS